MILSRDIEEQDGIAWALLSNVWPVLNAGRCLPIIEATFPLDHPAPAYRLMEDGTHAGKIVLTVAQM